MELLRRDVVTALTELFNRDETDFGQGDLLNTLIWTIHVLCLDADKLPEDLAQRYDIELFNGVLINHAFTHYYEQQEWAYLAYVLSAVQSVLKLSAAGAKLLTNEQLAVLVQLLGQADSTSDLRLDSLAAKVLAQLTYADDDVTAALVLEHNLCYVLFEQLTRSCAVSAKNDADRTVAEQLAWIVSNIAAHARADVQGELARDGRLHIVLDLLRDATTMLQTRTTLLYAVTLLAQHGTGDVPLRALVDGVDVLGQHLREHALHPLQTAVDLLRACTELLVRCEMLSPQELVLCVNGLEASGAPAVAETLLHHANELTWKASEQFLLQLYGAHNRLEAVYNNQE